MVVEVEACAAGNAVLGHKTWHTLPVMNSAHVRSFVVVRNMPSVLLKSSRQGSHLSNMTDMHR